MTYEDIQAAFEDAFMEHGVMGAPLGRLLKEEKSFKDWLIGEYGARFQITDPFYAFFLKTLELSNHLHRDTTLKKEQRWYPRFFLWYCATFKRMRAAEALFCLGYSLQGCVLLRDVRDWALYVAALNASVLTFEQLIGQDGITQDLATASESVRQKVHRQRLSAEAMALDHTMRKCSGLVHQDALRLWDRFLNSEVHGSEITMAIDGEPWYTGQGTFPLSPDKNHRTLRLFLNRSAEFCHLVHRVLPLLQLSPGALGQEWSRHWDLLDKALPMLYMSTDAPPPKHEPGFKELLEKKFSIAPDSGYFHIL